MSRVAPSATLSATPAALPRRELLAAYVEATKPGITKLVTITSMVGLGMALAVRWGGGQREWSIVGLLLLAVGCTIGTALSAAGANALNQWAERGRDAKMPRTAGRPIPSGKLRPERVLAFAIGLVIAGLALLLLTCGVAAATVSLACVLVYVLLYTPMKAATWTATLVGAIPGALPPLIGWSAGSADRSFGSVLEPGAVALFALMFVWQLPHFLAIAWMYRDDYRLGGCAVLPVVDRSGTMTAIVIAAFTLLLIPATMAPLWAMPGVLGLAYMAAVVLTGVGFGALVVRLLRGRTRDDARRVFFASIIHLPVLLIVMVGDAFLHSVL